MPVRVPEYDLFRYIISLATGDKRGLFRPMAGSMPDQIMLSQKFINAYSEFVRKFLVRDIIRTCGWQNFYLLEKEIVHECSAADSLFWDSLDFKFTWRGVQRIWHNFIFKDKREGSVEYEWISGWDAYLLTCLKVPLFINGISRWCISNEMPWLVTYKCCLSGSVPSTIRLFPYSDFYSAAAKISLPLRFILIEKTCGYYDQCINTLQFIRARLEKEGGSRMIRIKGITYYDPDRPFDLSRLLLPANFGFDLVARALELWKGSETLGYDDSLKIEGFCRNAGLYELMDQLRDLTNYFSMFAGDMKAGKEIKNAGNVRISVN